MAERVFLHIGAPKAGTTFLQTILWNNRDRLAAKGLLVPGRRMFDHNLAARAVTTHGQSSKPRPQAVAAWQSIVDETLTWDGDAVISNEWFAPASREQAQRALDHWPARRVHLVLTARAFVHQVPAAWQETVKLGRAQSMAEFTSGLDSTDRRWSWRALDPADALDRWAAALPAGNVHVVTVPPRGSDPQLLWKRLACLLGVDARSCDTTAADVNESLSAESARLLQLLGPLLRDAIDADNVFWDEQYRWIRKYVGHELLVPHGGSRIAMPAATVAALQARSRRSVDALLTAGYDIVGDAGELLAGQPPPGSRDPDDVADSELLGLSLPVIADMLRRVRKETLRADRAEKALRSLRAAQPDDQPEGRPPV